MSDSATRPTNGNQTCLPKPTKVNCFAFSVLQVPVTKPINVLDSQIKIMFHMMTEELDEQWYDEQLYDATVGSSTYLNRKPRKRQRMLTCPLLDTCKHPTKKFENWKKLHEHLETRQHADKPMDLETRFCCPNCHNPYYTQENLDIHYQPDSRLGRACFGGPKKRKKAPGLLKTTKPELLSELKLHLNELSICDPVTSKFCQDIEKIVFQYRERQRGFNFVLPLPPLSQ